MTTANPGDDKPVRWWVLRHVLWPELRKHARALDTIKKKITKLEENIMAQQSDIDALAAALAQEDSDLNTAVAGIQAEIAALQNAQPALDLSGLQSQVDAMRGAVDAASALVPPPA